VPQLRLALAQINPTSADIDGNAAKIVDAIAAASGQHAGLVITPELALPGYCIGDLVENTDFLEANESNNETWTDIKIGKTVDIVDYGPHV